MTKIPDVKIEFQIKEAINYKITIENHKEDFKDQ